MAERTHSSSHRLMSLIETDSERQALIFAVAAPHLAKLERYHRRALSRRKAAIRAFEAARRVRSESDRRLGESCTVLKEMLLKDEVRPAWPKNLRAPRSRPPR